MSKNDPIYNKRTYCNPIAIPECPMGEYDLWEDEMRYTGEEKCEYRTVSDPSVLFYDNKWYLYPSYGMAFVSEDFATWEHVRTVPYNPKYSPAITVHRGKFLLTSHSNGLYISDSPTGPFDFLGNFKFSDGRTYTLCNGTESQPIDPALFTDDDGKIYLYWFDARTDKSGNMICQTYGVELDNEDPTRFCTTPQLIHEFNGENIWERDGVYNQNTKFGWIEGQWMFKHNGRYYMIYSSPNTSLKSYCMAAYYSDEGPLTGFKCQKRNPVTQSRAGIISGAGHGSIVHGPNNSIWAFYTIAISGVHPFERRIGMDPIGIDENGELYRPGVSAVPMYAVGETEDYLDNWTGLLPLTFGHRHHIKSSSCAPGRNTMYAFDESLLSWWQPSEDDKEPELYVDLEATYICEASRIMWREIGLNCEKNILPGSFGYVIEGRETVGEGDWKMVLDLKNNDKDLIVDYRTFKPVLLREVRLRITKSPKGVIPGIISFSIFGTKA